MTRRNPKRELGGIRAARADLRNRFQRARFEAEKSAIREELIPGFRDRLLATIRTLQDLRASDFDEQLYVDYLSLVTGTAPQTARRWIDPAEPGLPDLVSFTTLCKVVASDPNWMLGLTKTRLPATRSDADWLHELVLDISQVAGKLTGMRVVGNEMEPEVRSGDWVLVDSSDRTWGRHGMYMLDYKGNPTLRTVGTKIGAGFVLSCSNDAHGEALIKDEAHAKSLGIQLLGRVLMKISLTRT
ncbi:MAG: S24 family peptidase [Candidatus Methylophosphatis roskildensis]